MTTPKRTGAKLRSFAGWVLPFEWAWPFDVCPRRGVAAAVD